MPNSKWDVPLMSGKTDPATADNPPKLKISLTDEDEQDEGATTALSPNEVYELTQGRGHPDAPAVIRLEVAAEGLDSAAQAERIRIYVYLRQNEGFSKTELDVLDAWPLRLLQRESRKLLVARGHDEDDDQPPDIPMRQSPGPENALPAEGVRQRNLGRLMDEARNKSATSAQRKRARLEFLKASGTQPKKRIGSKV